MKLFLSNLVRYTTWRETATTFDSLKAEKDCLNTGEDMGRQVSDTSQVTTASPLPQLKPCFFFEKNRPIFLWAVFETMFFFCVFFFNTCSNHFSFQASVA